MENLTDTVRDKERLLIAENIRKKAWKVAKRIETGDTLINIDYAIAELKLAILEIKRHYRRYSKKK